MYYIKTIDNINDVEQGNVADINIYNWGCEYQPKAYAKFCYVKDQGFVLKITAEEKDPLTTFSERDSFVCQDSCLECFVNFKPQKEENGYINFEANSAGALLCQYGKEGPGRQTLTQMGVKDYPEMKPFKTENKWGYTMFIPLDIIQFVYGESDFKKGDKLTGNFFKCGDKTASPHYGSFTKIDWEFPSFHRPQFFDDMEIV